MNRKVICTYNLMATALIGVVVSFGANAIDSLQEAIVTPAYEKSMRTLEILEKCDTNGDGKVSEEEGEAHFRKVFATLDANHDGKLDSTEWNGAARNVQVISISTGGYARALSSMAMMEKCDANDDRVVSENEFLAIHQNLFNQMAAGDPSIDAEHWIAAHIPIGG